MAARHERQRREAGDGQVAMKHRRVPEGTVAVLRVGQELQAPLHRPAGVGRDQVLIITAIGGQFGALVCKGRKTDREAGAGGDRSL